MSLHCDGLVTSAGSHGIFEEYQCNGMVSVFCGYVEKASRDVHDASLTSVSTMYSELLPEVYPRSSKARGI